MTGSEALAVLDDFAAINVPVWIAGGWGVDALVGRQTRDHLDLDLLFNRDQEEQVIAMLRKKAFAETLDWRPGRFVMSDSARELDLHPMEILDAGGAILHTQTDETFVFGATDFVEGSIDGLGVRCLSAARQWEFHHGYEPAAKDLHDLMLLRELLGNP